MQRDPRRIKGDPAPYSVAEASKRKSAWRRDPVKTILAAAMILAMVISGFSLWNAVHAHWRTVSSSQIFIDGTPVCVMQEGRDIVASVGMCGAPGGESPEDGIGSGGGFHRRAPYPGYPHPVLPPGHPPIDSPRDTEEGRRILI